MKRNLFIPTRAMVKAMPRTPYPVQAHAPSGSGMGELVFITHNATPKIVYGPFWDYYTTAQNIPDVENTPGYSEFTINMRNAGSGVFKYSDMIPTLTFAADPVAAIEIRDENTIPKVLGPNQTVSFIVRVYNTVAGLYRFNIAFTGVENNNYVTADDPQDPPTLTNVRFTASSVVDVTPTPTPNWANVAWNDSFTLYAYSARIVEGINQPITLQLTWSGLAVYMYRKVQATAFSPTDGSSFTEPFNDGYIQMSSGNTFTINNNDWVSFTTYPGPSYKGGTSQVPITVTNVTDGNTVIDTFDAIVQP